MLICPVNLFLPVLNEHINESDYATSNSKSGDLDQDDSESMDSEKALNLVS